MKKIMCLLLVCTFLLGMCSCGKEEKAEEKSEAEEKSPYIGEVVIFEDDGYLDDYDTISIDIPNDVAKDEYYTLMGVYLGDDYTYYYLPDPEALENGQVVFETLHHSKYAAVKTDKSVQIEEWTKRAAVNIVTQNTANGKIEETLGDIVNDALKELGVNSGTYGGTILEYMLSQDTKGEILQAALNGDQTALKDKTASLLADALCSQAKIEGAGDLVDIVCAYKNSEDWAEGAINVSKEIQKKIFPEIDAVSKFADLVDKTFDIWAANTMDEVYRYQYKKMADFDGNISDDDWNTLYSTIKGAWARFQSKGISEESLRESFKKRAENEQKISETETELKKFVKQWDEDGLLNPYCLNYSNNWTVADRLKSLYESRETLRKMFTKDGKLQKGDYIYLNDDEFLDRLLFQWTFYGTKERSKFYQWLEDEKIVPKTEYKELYAWYLVDTEVEQKDNETSDFYGDPVYVTTYEASENSHTQINEYVYYKDPYEKGTFIATCETPPALIKPDTEFPLHLTIKSEGTTGHYFSASAWYKLESPDIHFGATTGMSKFETKDNKGTFTVGTREEDGGEYDETVYGFMNKGSAEGARLGIFFCACGADTRWIYEWRKVGVSN